jgi:radical SAM superfamily enzyme YgiQ (UPF0313 family)
VRGSSEKPVVLVAFDKYENLGVRYLYSIISRAGYRVHIIDFEQDKKSILSELLKVEALLVGFSIIFEQHFDEFRDLIEYLRENGVRGHFTAGGHHPSLHPEELLQLIPSLDSIVRFEGEYTILELIAKLSTKAEWKSINGISYREESSVVHNHLRPVENNLDMFPWPDRSNFQNEILGKKIRSILAGRGCIHRCIFCNSREFYIQSTGPIKRIRDPDRVVEEMYYLYKQWECSVFLFQDDDFPVTDNYRHDWIEQFCKALRRYDLKGKIMWQISCRPDEVSADIFKYMRDYGLFRVFMGIDDGTKYGLSYMRKSFLPEDTLKSVSVLKDLGLLIDYGFMLFNPETTFDSLHDNLDFLEKLCSDGLMPVLFSKMEPFLETPIAKILEKEGRLIRRSGSLDYGFHEGSMDAYFKFVSNNLDRWLYAENGLLNLEKCAAMFLSVFRFYYGKVGEIDRWADELKTEIAANNLFLLNTMRKIANFYEFGSLPNGLDYSLVHLKAQIEEKHPIAVDHISGFIERLNLLNLTKSIFISVH